MKRFIFFSSLIILFVGLAISSASSPWFHSQPNYEIAFSQTEADSEIAQASTFSLKSQTINSGGSVASGGNYRLQGSTGQAAVGVMTGNDYYLISGFWHPGDFTVYLPFIIRQ